MAAGQVLAPQQQTEVGAADMSLPPDTNAAIRHHEQVLAQDPDNATSHYNIALLYKRAMRFEDAVAAYENAIRLGIDYVQEVYLNLGVLYSEMRRGEQSRAMYEQALAIDPEYVPALFNLAGLCEETGARAEAADLFRRILGIDPQHWESLSRLAYLHSPGDAGDDLTVSLRDAIAGSTADPLAQESLHFALGKLLDQVGDYEEAFEAYRTANEIGRRRSLAYDAHAVESAFAVMPQVFDKSWLDNAETTCEAEPVFICGMYRSGSTLTEQVLSAHPSVRAGGELDILPWLLQTRIQPFPQGLETATADTLLPLAEDYLAELERLFPGATHVTDKRPDNFLHLGVIRAMFPRARIIYTRRSMRDNCLSVYFQQLGEQLRYATDLASTAHYYEQHERLMEHWQQLLGESIFTVDYDHFVRDPRPVLADLLEFLGLPWDDRCLDFHKARTLVKTASVWQVREPLHERSSGRWRNYEAFVDTISGLQ